MEEEEEEKSSGEEEEKEQSSGDEKEELEEEEAIKSHCRSAGKRIISGMKKNSKPLLLNKAEDLDK